MDRDIELCVDPDGGWTYRLAFGMLQGVRAMLRQLRRALLLDRDRLPPGERHLAQTYRLGRAARERLVFKVLLPTDGSHAGWADHPRGRRFREMSGC